MALEKSPENAAPSLERDFELEYEPVGPTARMMMIESDPEGGIFYQFQKRKPRCLHLSPQLALGRFLLIDTVHVALLLEPDGSRLAALGAFGSSGNTTFLLGPHWGRWVDEDTRVHKSDQIIELMRRWKVPVTVNDAQKLLAIDFLINVYHRAVFTHDALSAFRYGDNRHQMSLMYRYPEGRFETANVTIYDSKSDRLRYIFDVNTFPLQVPERTPPPPDTREELRREAQRRAQLSRDHRPPAAAPEAAEPERKEPAPEKGDGKKRAENAAPPPAQIPAPPPPAPEKPRPTEPPLPTTEHLSTHDLLGVLSTERDARRQWRIIEPNLMKGRPERTYPLALNHAELIAENTRDWAPARLKVAFAHQPGIVLFALMRRWSNNQVLAVAQDNAEEAQILQWLREREIDRLMQLKTRQEPTSASEARDILRVDRNADEAAIKKTWRILLGALHADLGRSQERPIHRKKDEIAKHLQAARNLLLKML